jgi:hypothetical protein
MKNRQAHTPDGFRRQKQDGKSHTAAATTQDVRAEIGAQDCALRLHSGVAVNKGHFFFLIFWLCVEHSDFIISKCDDLAIGELNQFEIASNVRRVACKLL